MAQNRLALGAVVMGVCNALKIVVQLVLTPILARLLGPANFGLYSLAQPSILFVMMLADAGLGQSLAREDEDHDTVWSSAFWLLLSLGVVLSAGVSLWSIPLSMIAHQQQLPLIMAPLSLCIILLTMTVAPTARLTRRGRIEAFALIDLLANFIGAAVAVGAALMGLGVWSLVLQFLTLYGVRAAAVNAMAFHPPKVVFDWKAIAPHTMLGGAIVITKFIDSVGRMLESTIVSRRFGSSGLGVYAFSNQAAWSLVQSVNNPAGTMMYIDSLSDKGEAAVKALYRRLVRVVAMTTLPAMAVIGAVAPLLTATLLGKAWLSGALLIATVFPSQALGTLTQLSGAVLYAQGRARGQTWLALIYGCFRVSAVIVPFGGWPAVAIYIGIANTLYFFMGMINARVQLGWSFATTLDVVWGPIAAAAIAGIATFFLSPYAPKGLIGLIGLMGVGGVIYCLALLALNFKDLREDWDEVLSMIKRREQPAPAAS